MDRITVLAAATLLLLLPATILGQLPSGACYAEEVTCELQDDNLVRDSIHVHIPFYFLPREKPMI